MNAMDALLMAVSYGNTPLFIQLLNQPENRSKLPSTILGHDCLNSAILNGHGEIVKILISLPLSEFDWTQVPLADHGALTYLSRAATFDQFEIFKTIVESGKANITERDQKGHTAFHYACASGCLSIVEFLLQQEGVNPNERSNMGRTPLLLAAMEGSEPVTRRLMGINGVDPDARDQEGKTPFYWALVYGHNAVAGILVSSGRVNRGIMARALQDRLAAQQSEPTFTWHVLE
ncbi:ankyrin repeat, ph and sec7 domain containing protein secg [Fusarium flagelliforme]|uniref:Ankyrin repeat, ph and sec7 domain containing protein secg n=1 Tax=Fusarium flagelliforme TaxID=2675880 RepID=A0A395MSL0_9HYPO|nr:ankyrin repeat, ph and sec7 domain containing protein secg [Fusarium flagelliforme]